MSDIEAEPAEDDPMTEAEVADEATADEAGADEAGDAEAGDDSMPTPPPTETTLAVILAAGAGSRFNGQHHKLETKLKGKPLVWWATQHAIDAGFAEVLVVEGSVPVQNLVPDSASIIRNDDWEDGQARSLHVAVHYAGMFGYDCVVVGLGDQPFAPPEAWLAQCILLLFLLCSVWSDKLEYNFKFLMSY